MLLKSLTLSVFLLAGCTSVPIVKVMDTPIINPPLPPKLKLRPVEWSVINVDTNSYFALDSEGYENLASNIDDITGYLEKTRIIIRYYQTIHTTNTPVVVTNKTFFQKVFGK